MNNKVTQPKHAVLYLRAARANRPDDDAVAAQRTKCMEYAERLDLRVAREYVDVGSGLQSSRPGLTRMLSDLEQQRDVSTAVVWDMARLARNHIDLTRILDRMRALDVRVLVASSGEEVNDKEKFTFGVQALIGQWASEEKGVGK
jgi:DNA invertase Pin-like site-specific DNA recombinase